ncbi:MAG: NADH-quinone oxidoreductase subunit C [Actinobacteria bacterium]|nr:NADH-quinone oxidoreductase subunit C [Actinomycetota bacterium]
MTQIQIVENSDWQNQAAQLKQSGFVRCEWLTATHNGGDAFEISLMLATEDLSKSLILTTQIESKIDSLTQVFSSVDFHEREVAQMFGVEFVGNSNSLPAFEIELSGFPLRRDFALVTRAGAQWPGAVEPDENTKRRPTLPPGVLPEWKS